MRKLIDVEIRAFPLSILVRYPFSNRLLLLAALFLPGSLPALPEALVLSDEREEYTPGRGVEFIRDQDGTLTLADLLQPEAEPGWTRNEQDVPNFGYTRSAVWVRLNITSEAKEREHWKLEVANPQMDYVEVFLPDGAGGFDRRESGFYKPLSAREIKHRNAVFSWVVKPGQGQILYLRFRTESTMTFPIKIWSDNAFASYANDQQYVFGMYYGIMLVMVVYNLFLGIFLRDVTYFTYVAFISGLSMATFFLYGFANLYLLPDVPTFAKRGVPFFVGLTGVAGLVFIRMFLSTKAQFPRTDLVIKCVLAFSIVQTVISGFVSFVIVLKLAVGLMLVFSLLALFAGGFALFKGVRSARYFVLAWTLFMAGVFLLSLRSFGVLPQNFLTYYGVQIGSALEVAVLSLALADRINILKSERAAADQERIRQQAGALSYQNRLTRAFARFVPDEFLKLLGKASIVEIELGDAVRKEMTILFSDIRSFTSLSETLTPEESFGFINEYLARIGPIIRSNNGFIDKYIGDAIMALFPRSPEDAIHASLAMMAELERYNEDRHKRGFGPIKIGIGVHTGMLMLGTVGEAERLEGTVISDAVNLASRVEGLSKQYGASILASDSVVARLEDPTKYAFRFMDRTLVKGKTDPVSVFEFLDGDAVSSRDQKLKTKAEFERGIERFHSGQVDEARRLFETVLMANPADEAALFYRDRCGK